MNKKLHLGCGFIYKKGWVNLDKLSHVKSDVYHDLNKFPYPFNDNCFYYVYSDGVIEHLDDLIKHFNEIWRISKPNAIIEFKVPFCLSQNNFIDFTHKNSFHIKSMEMICDNTLGRRYIENKFDLVFVKPIKGRIGFLFPEFVCNKICNVVGEVYQSIVFKIIVKK